MTSGKAQAAALKAGELTRAAERNFKRASTTAKRLKAESREAKAKLKQAKKAAKQASKAARTARKASDEARRLYKKAVTRATTARAAAAKITKATKAPKATTETSVGTATPKKKARTRRAVPRRSAQEPASASPGVDSDVAFNDVE